MNEETHWIVHGGNMDGHRVAGPAVAAAMIVGVVIAPHPGADSGPGNDLTFVPKILAVMATVALSAPFIGAQISIFTT